MTMTRKQMQALNREQREQMPRYRTAVLGGVDEEKRTVTMSFASQTPCPDWWGDQEVLRCDDVSMNTERFTNGIMPILFNHNRDIIIGKPLKVWTENGRAMLEMEFASTDKAEEVFGLVRDGFCNGVSVGYRVTEWSYLAKGERSQDGIEGPCYIAERWEVFEASIVSVPADASVGVGRSLPFYNEGPEPEEPSNERGIKKMEPNNNPDVNGITAAEAERQAQEAAERAQKAERERCENISSMCNQYGIEAKHRDAWIKNGDDMTTAYRAALEIIAERSKPKPNNPVPGEDESDKRRAAFRDAILIRGGVTASGIDQGARQFAHMSMRDMACDMLIRSGEKNVMGMGNEEVYKRALTTGALPMLLSDVTQLSMQQGYEKANTTWQEWARIGSLKDFRPTYRAEIGLDGNPVLIPENGEFTDADMAESENAVRLHTYGRSYSYTRQAFINDDLDVLTTIPAALGRKYSIHINQMCYKALTGATYGAGNTGTAGAVSTTTISEALVKLAKQKNPLDGEYLRIPATKLLVPVAVQAAAAQFLASSADPNGKHAGVANIYSGAFKLISDVELDLASADAWYMMGDFPLGHGIEVDFLNGNQTPILESQVSFDTLGWKYRSYLDYGVTALDVIGIIKNAGK